MSFGAAEMMVREIFPVPPHFLRKQCMYLINLVAVPSLTGEKDSSKRLPGYGSVVECGCRGPFLFSSAQITLAGPACVGGGRRWGKQQIRIFFKEH